MAYWIVKTNYYNNSKLFHCDYVTDINKLPTQISEGERQEGDTISSYKCTPGSVCLCHEDSSKWLLGKDTNQWVKQSGESSVGISYFNDEPDSLTEGMTWIGE